MLKRKLNQVLSNKPQPAAPKPDFAAVQALRGKIKQWSELPLSQFCRTKPDFDAKHGLVYKLLRTSKDRLRDSTLCSHDSAFWLRNYQDSVSALWVIKLAGKDVGNVSRNQLMQWLRDRGETASMMEVYKWTKKWGFLDNNYTKTIISSPKTAEQARAIYKESKSLMSTKASKQALANKLLSELLNNSDLRKIDNPEKWAEDVFAVFKTFNKDLVTFQVMLGGMIKFQPLRRYHQEVWELATKQESANNIKIDKKLVETNERVMKLINSANKQNERN